MLILLCVITVCCGRGTVHSNAGDSQPDTWLADAFAVPDREYRMTKLLYGFDENYESVLHALYKYGYGGVVTNVPFNEQYLKDKDEFDRLDDAFSYAWENGLPQLWIYDEYQWPSGTAYGQVLEGNPEYESVGIGWLQVEGTGNYFYTLPYEYEEIVYAELIEGNTKTPIPFRDTLVQISSSGSWKLNVYATCKPYVDPGEEAYSWDRLPYINILSEGAVSKFLKLTHERYKEYLDGSFSHVTAFFTDEPALRTSYMKQLYPMTEHLMPWEASLPDVFQEMHGYSLFDHMQSLYEGDTDRDKAVRVNFYQTVAHMAASSYFRQIEVWCRENGVASSGHPLLEECLSYHVALYGDLMAILNEMGMPGCDLLMGRPSAMMNTDHYIGNFQAVKFAASAARNNRREGVMVEFNPAAAKDEMFDQNPFGESLGSATLTLLFGADHFVMLNPQETYSEQEARILNEYVGRVNTVLDGAVMDSGIAVFYPVAAMQARLSAGQTRDTQIYELDAAFNKLCKGLIENGIDFNYIDEAAIAKATVSDGKMICGDTAYAVIVLPFVECMALSTMEKLEKFQEQGGKVLWVRDLPSYATDYENTDKLLAKTKQFEKYVIAYGNYEGDEKTLKPVVDAIRSCMIYNYTVQRSSSDIFLSTYEREGRQILFVANSLPEDGSVTVSFGDGAAFDVYDPYTGDIVSYRGETTLTCPAYRGLLLVSGYEAPVVSDAIFYCSVPDTAERTNFSSRIIWIAVSAAAAAVIAAAVCAGFVIKNKKARGK